MKKQRWKEQGHRIIELLEQAGLSNEEAWNVLISYDIALMGHLQERVHDA